MIRRPPRSTLFPTRRSSDLARDERRDRDGADFLQREVEEHELGDVRQRGDRKSTRLNSSHVEISYAVFCLKKKKKKNKKKYRKRKTKQHYKQALDNQTRR